MQMLKPLQSTEDCRKSHSALNLVSKKPHLQGTERRAASADTTPEMQKKKMKPTSNGVSEAESLESLQLGDMSAQFTGSTGSLPSIGTSSVSDCCPTPDTNGGESLVTCRDTQHQNIAGMGGAKGESPAVSSTHPTSSEVLLVETQAPSDGDSNSVAKDLVAGVLKSAAAKLERTNQRAD